MIIDHTNNVFTYTDDPNPKKYFMNTDNPITCAATAMKNGFAAYALGGGVVPATGVRPKITFMLGMTTAWYIDGMNGGNPSLKLQPMTTDAGTNKEKRLEQADIDEYIQKRTVPFNEILQLLWDNYAQYADVWQRDPANGTRSTGLSAS